MNETKLRVDIARHAKSIFDRGLTSGSTGNISVRTEDGWLMTPTGSSMGETDPARISKLDAQGRQVSGDPPTKEACLHRAMYEKRTRAKAVVHLHSTHSVAVSCLCGLDSTNVLPPPSDGRCSRRPNSTGKPVSKAEAWLLKRQRTRLCQEE